MQNGKFVIDTVIHAFNLSEENFAYPRYASAINELILGVTGIVPSGYGLPRDAVIRDWPIEDAANMVFRESHTDVAVYHPVPIFAYKDGQSAFPKGVEAIKRWPNRFIGMYVSLDPLRPGTDAIAELNRQIDEVEAAGQKPLGLKLYPTTGFYPDDEIVYPLYEVCCDHDVPVLLHQGHSGGRLKSKYGHPIHVDSVAADFPDLKIIMGHGARLETWGKEALSVAIYKTNVHIEISLWQHWASVDELVRLFVWIRDRIGIDRLLFGSDMTNTEVSMSLREWVETIAMFPEWAKQLGFRLTEEEIGLVLGGNAKRVYKLPI